MLLKAIEASNSDWRNLVIRMRLQQKGKNIEIEKGGKTYIVKKNFFKKNSNLKKIKQDKNHTSV